MISHQQPHYQPVKDCTQWPVLGYFNNSNRIQFLHKTKYSEELEKFIRLYLTASVKA